MRSFLIFISVLFLSALGFGIYWMMQGPEGPVTKEKAKESPLAVAPMPTTSYVGTIGPVQGAWVERYDKKGELTSRIRAERYEPQKDSVWLAIKPEVEFFLKKDKETDEPRILRITGKTGTVTMLDTISRMRNIPGGSSLGQTPRMGDLHDVVLEMLPGAGKAPTLTVTMNNVSFDNETYRFATESYVDKGRTIPGSQVPVTLRSADYQFDGRGFTLQYNEVDRRVEHMRVEHAQRLLVTKPGKVFGGLFEGPVGPTTRPAPAGQTSFRNAVQPIPEIVLAAAERGLPPGTGAPAPRRPRRAPPEPTSRPKAEEPVYRITLNDSVEIIQGGRKLLTAQDMQLDFLGEEGGETLTDVAASSGDRPGKSPASRPAGAGARPSQPEKRDPAAAAAPRTAIPKADAPKADAPKTDKAGTADAPKVAKADAARSPSSRPAEPVEVHWKGPMVIVPLPGDPPSRIAPGEWIVHITGTKARPVEITPVSKGISSTIRCASLTYWTIDEGVLLEEAPEIPVSLSDSRGTNIVTRNMVVSRRENTAQLTGASSARLALPESGKDAASKAAQPKFLDARWADRCTLYFDNQSKDELVINRADLAGKVVIDHPQMMMQADMVDLALDNSAPAAAGAAPATQPASSSPQIRKVDAKGNVHCAVNGPGGDADKRRIDCQSLVLDTAQGTDGKLFVQRLTAIGGVHVADPKRALDAGYLTATMAQPTTKPTTQPAVAAVPTTQPAVAKSEKSDFSAGELQSMVAHDNVHITTMDGMKAECDELHIKGVGQNTSVSLSGRPAKVLRKTETLSGQLITMVPETQELMMIGAGQLDGTQRSEPGQPVRPFSVTWTKSLMGKSGRIECEGDVVARTVDTDGAVNIATGDRVTLTTVAAATTQPAEKKVATTKPSGDLDVMSDREIRSIVLDGNAKVDSDLLGAQGELLRRFHVDSQTIQYFQVNPKQRRLVIPNAGRMLVVDNRQPAKSAAAKEAAADPINIRGQTAFWWKQSLVYDEASSQVEMLGDVMVRRIQAGTGEKKEDIDLTLNADRIIGDIDNTEPAGAATQPATRPAERGSFDVKMQLKQVRAEGKVVVVGKDINLQAHSLEYEPAKHRLFTRGNATSRVRYEHGLDLITFDEVTFDTLTWHFPDAKGMRVEATGKTAAPTVAPLPGQ